MQLTFALYKQVFETLNAYVLERWGDREIYVKQLTTRGSSTDMTMGISRWEVLKPGHR